jgi:hypothetical protein
MADPGKTAEGAGYKDAALLTILQRILTRVPRHWSFGVGGDLHGTLVKSLMC